MKLFLLVLLLIYIIGRFGVGMPFPSLVQGDTSLPVRITISALPATGLVILSPSSNGLTFLPSTITFANNEPPTQTVIITAASEATLGIHQVHFDSDNPSYSSFVSPLPVTRRGFSLFLIIHSPFSIFKISFFQHRFFCHARFQGFHLFWSTFLYSYNHNLVTTCD